MAPPNEGDCGANATRTRLNRGSILKVGQDTVH